MNFQGLIFNFKFTRASHLRFSLLPLHRGTEAARSRRLAAVQNPFASIQRAGGGGEEVMRFTASPVVELSVGGAMLTFEQDNDSFEVGTSVWPSSLVLVKFVERCLRDPALPFADVLRFPGTRAVELGSGCGPAGLGLSRLGLTDLVLTDIAAVLPALRRNLRRNRLHLPRAPRLAQLHWNCPAHLTTLATPRRFDLVVAADVVYVQESVPHLIAAMDALADAERGVVLLGYQIRSPEAHQAFWDSVPAAFPVIEKVPREHLDPSYAYEESDVYILRRRPRQ